MNGPRTDVDAGPAEIQTCNSCNGIFTTAWSQDYWGHRYVNFTGSRSHVQQHLSHCGLCAVFHRILAQEEEDKFRNLKNYAADIRPDLDAFDVKIEENRDQRTFESFGSQLSLLRHGYFAASLHLAAQEGTWVFRFRSSMCLCLTLLQAPRLLRGYHPAHPLVTIHPLGPSK